MSGTPPADDPHNLLRAAGTLTSATRYAVARGATLRKTRLTSPPGLPALNAAPVLHLPTQWPGADARLGFWNAIFTT
jgi:hypothetical protein